MPVTRLVDIEHVTYGVRSSPDEVVYPFLKIRILENTILGV